MMSSVRVGDHEFTIEREMLDVSSMCRPDTNWRVVCRVCGWYHQWHGVYVSGTRAADVYSPTTRYELPTLIWVWFEEPSRGPDDEWPDPGRGYYACRGCGATIVPRYTADTVQQMIPGLAHYHVNGVSMSREAFFAQLSVMTGIPWDPDTGKPSEKPA